MLTVDGITFQYNGRKILDGFSFAAGKGEILSILGPNGVGKTTLLKCMNGILKPKKGSVLVENTDILEMEALETARRIGYVAQTQEPARLTAFDTILMGRRPHIRFRVTEKDLKIVDAAIHRLSLDHLAMRYIDQMSGGELQKVAIARALVQEPRILLLDEPTASLDLKNQVDILSLIRKVVKSHEMAAVMTMHDLNMALRFSDNFLFLKEGRIHSMESPSTVTAKTVESVYGVAVEVHQVNGMPTVIPAVDHRIVCKEETDSLHQAVPAG